MSYLVGPRARGGATISPPEDIDSINDEELLRQLWQQAEDLGERRKYRARMYRLRDERLREMVENDAEALGALVTQDGSDANERQTTPQRRQSNIKVTMKFEGGTAVTDSISAQNVKVGGLTMRTSTTTKTADDIINDRINEVSKDRTNRYERILGEMDQPGNDSHVSITKSTYSIQSNALSGGSYMSMKNNEVRDSVSPTRNLFGRSRSPGTDSDNLNTDDEIDAKSKNSSRKSSRDERSPSPTKNRPNELSLKNENKRKISERKLSKDSIRKSDSAKSSPASSPTRSPTRSASPRKSPNSPSIKSNLNSPSSPTRKQVSIAKQMDKSISNEINKLDSYIQEKVGAHEEILTESKENVLDESGHEVKMIQQTIKNKDGTEFTARTMAQSTKIVDDESEIDEILVGNKEHEVLERDVTEEETDDGSKIKIITETRRRPDGIEYTTKNVLKTSKIFDYDHPEDVAYSETDELISTDENEEIDDQGATIKTVTETRRKADGVEYTTKKVYKTSKVSTKITPSDDDEVIDSKENEEVQEDGSIVRVVTETRRTKDGAEYTHRQVYKSRRMTLSALQLQKQGLPMMDNDDEVLDKNENEEMVDGVKVTVVTETRKRTDGSTYSYDYVLQKRKFQGTKEELQNMAPAANNTNIAVSAEDKLIKEDIKDELQEDGSNVRTIIERRRAKDGTEYLRHRIMRIPKMIEPTLQAGSLDDEVLDKNIDEDITEDGIKYKNITERRRSSATGLQYTLRRMSKVFQAAHKAAATEDTLMDENIAEEELEDGSLLKTIIKRYERADGSIYSTQNVHKSFHSPTPITLVGHENDELIDSFENEESTGDGYIVKTMTEVRRRSDGAEYTIEKSEKKPKISSSQISFISEKRINTQAPTIQLLTSEDVVISRDENEVPEEDGTVVTTIVEIRQRPDGSQYTSKTVEKSMPLLVPDRETSYVVIKPDVEEDEPSFMPSLDDEVVYVRNKKEVNEKGETINVVIETRKSKTTGEMYNITKRVHEVDVILTEDGEKEVPKKTKISEKKINLSVNKGLEKTVEIPVNDDVPYGSVSALKNRFAPNKMNEKSSNESKKPNKTNTLNAKKFFEEAAKTVEPKTPSWKSNASVKKSQTESAKKMFESNASISTSANTKNKASLEVTLNFNSDDVSVKDIKTSSLSVQPSVELIPPQPSESESKSDSDIENVDPIEEKLITEQPNLVSQPVKSKETPKPKKKTEPIKAKREISPKKTVQPTPKRKSPTLQNRVTKKDTSPTKTSPPQRKSPTRKEKTQTLAPPSQNRGRSPNRSGVSTPRDLTPNGRQCCQRHREASGTPTPAPEETAPKRVAKTSNRSANTSPTKINSDSKRTVGRFTVDANKKSISRRVDTEKTTNSKPTRQSTLQSTRRPTSKSPEKSPTSKTTTRPTAKSPTKLKGRTSPKSSLNSESKPTKPESKSSSNSKQNEPVVTLPETPMVETKILPGENEPEIEDVSSESLPIDITHKRPSIIRQPSEFQGVDEEIINKSEYVEVESTQSSSIEQKESKLDVTEKESKTSSLKLEKETTKSLGLKDIGIHKKNIDTPNKLKNLKLIDQKAIDNSEKIINKNVGQRYNPSNAKNNRPERKISLESKGTVNSRRSMFEKGDSFEVAPSPMKKTIVASSKINTNKFKINGNTTNYEVKQPVEEPIIVPKKMYVCGENETTNTLSEVNSESTASLAKSVLTESNVSLSSKSERKESFKREQSPFSKENSPFPEREREGSPFSKEGSPSRFATGRPIDQGVNANKIKRLERASSNKKLLEDLEVPKSDLPDYLSSIEKIEDVTLLESMLQKAESYEERRVIRGQLRNAKRPATKSNQSDRSTYKRFVDMTPRSSNPNSPQLGRRNQESSENLSRSQLQSRDSTIEPTSLKSLSQSDDSGKWQEQCETLVVNDSTNSISSSSEKMESNVSRKVSSTESRKMSTDESRKVSVDENRKLSNAENRKVSTASSTYDSSEKFSRTSSVASLKQEKVVSENFSSSSSSNSSSISSSSSSSSSSSMLKSETKSSMMKSGVQEISEEPYEPYIEPLRHQKTKSKGKTTPVQNQSDVDKIVSPYGVGPTDGNGMPLFGLRALKKRNTQMENVAPPPTEPEPKSEDYEPTDASGKPMFGLRSLRTATSSSTTASSMENYESSSFSRDNASNDLKGEGSPSNEESDKVRPTAKLRDSFIAESSPKTTKKYGDGKIGRRSQPLDSIIKLHESKVSDQDKEETAEIIPPKKKLKETFEPVEKHDRSKKTWDLKSDLSIRSQDVKNIISRHESISQFEEESLTAANSDKKLTGILKKSSTSSQPSASSVSLERTLSDGTDSVVSGPYKSPDDLLDTLTDDQINRLSCEFDRRAQDDGVIKSETESREDINIIGSQVSKNEKERKQLRDTLDRKTSYTEIVLSKTNGTNEMKSSSVASASSYSTKNTQNFLQDKSKVTGIQDVMSRMAASEAVDTEGKVASDEEARSLLNKFLGAQVLMSGMESMMANANLKEKSTTDSASRKTVTREAAGHSSKTVMKNGKVTEQKSSSFSTGPKTVTVSTSGTKASPPVVIKGVNISEVNDDVKLNQLLDSCEEYEDRRRIRMRLKTLMSEKKALRAELNSHGKSESSKATTSADIRSSADLAVVNNWLSENFPDHKNAKNKEQKSATMQKFSSNTAAGTPGIRGRKRDDDDLDLITFNFKANSTKKTPAPPTRPSAVVIKKTILDFCKRNTAEYESKGIKIENFSTSWNDGMAFCALIHHFYPEAFDFDKLDPSNRRYNFELAFKMFDDKAGVAALLDVDDMVAMKKPDWKCVFTYIQTIYKALS